MLLLVCGCQRVEWTSAKAESDSALSWGLRSVELRLEPRNAREVVLQMRNVGSTEVCMWASRLPSETSAQGFRVFARDGAERRAGAVDSTADDSLFRLDNGDSISIDVGITPLSETAMAEGDCILFEVIYFDCRAGAQTSPERGPGIEHSGLAQGAWIYSSDRFENVRSANSCLARSLIDPAGL